MTEPTPSTSRQVQIHNYRSENIAAELCALMEHISASDVVLLCNEITLPANKRILASNSTYFKEMFANHPEIKQIVFPGLEPSVLKSLVEFMYTGHTNILKKDLKHVIASARCFGIPALQSIEDETAQLEADGIHMSLPIYLEDETKLVRVSNECEKDTAEPKELEMQVDQMTEPENAAQREPNDLSMESQVSHKSESAAQEQNSLNMMELELTHEPESVAQVQNNVNIDLQLIVELESDAEEEIDYLNLELLLQEPETSAQRAVCNNIITELQLHLEPENAAKTEEFNNLNMEIELTHETESAAKEEKVDLNMDLFQDPESAAQEEFMKSLMRLELPHEPESATEIEQNNPNMELSYGEDHQPMMALTEFYLNQLDFWEMFKTTEGTQALDPTPSDTSNMEEVDYINPDYAELEQFLYFTEYGAQQ